MLIPLPGWFTEEYFRLAGFHVFSSWLGLLVLGGIGIYTVTKWVTKTDCSVSERRENLREGFVYILAGLAFKILGLYTVGLVIAACAGFTILVLITGFKMAFIDREE